MADLETFSPIQALIETWWKEQRPEGDDSPAPRDLPIYRELLEFTKKKLKESKIVTGKTYDGETSYMAIGSAGESRFHVVPTDGPPMYEANHETRTKTNNPETTPKRAITRRSTLLPVGKPFECGGFFDYIGRNGSNTYSLFGRKPDAVTYELTMTPDGLISGTSKDICGKATIDGTIDSETGAVSLAKHYSWCNLWAQWNYQGQLEQYDGRTVILGRWESGRFAIWLNSKGIDHNEMTELVLLALDARDAHPS